MDNKNVALSSYPRRKSRIKDYPDVLDVEQVSEILGVSKKTGYAVLQKGGIDYIRVGRSYRIPKKNLLRYLSGPIKE